MRFSLSNKFVFNTESMKLKKLVTEIFNNRNKHDGKREENEHNLSNFWKIFITSLVIVALILLFICYCRYVYGRIFHVYERCIKGQKNITKDSVLNIKTQQGDSFIKSQFVSTDPYNLIKSKRIFRCSRDENCEKEKCYKLSSLLQEKKKLLTPKDTKENMIRRPNEDELTKKLSLKMYFQSLSNQNIKLLPPTITQTPRRTPTSFDNKCSYKDRRNICFSDTDLKFLVIPISSKNYDKLDPKRLIQNKWNSRSIDDQYKDRNCAVSKLIELQLENKDISSDYAQKYEVANPKSSCSPCSFISKTLTFKPKFFSDSNMSKLESSPDMLSKNLERSRTSNCYSSSSPLNISSTVKTKVNHSENDNMLSRVNVQDENYVFNTTMEPVAKNTKSKTFNIEDFQSTTDQSECYQKISNSDEHIIDEITMFELPEDIENEKHFTVCVDPISTSDKSFRRYNDISTRSALDSETSGTYDELGMLFSQYMKFQTRPCQRKYCSLSRHLRIRNGHDEKKCHLRLNAYRPYPYDQRPACSSGNVCKDTYDEFDLMRTSPSDRRSIYQRMFKRRKQFLDQPYISLR